MSWTYVSPAVNMALCLYRKSLAPPGEHAGPSHEYGLTPHNEQTEVLTLANARQVVSDQWWFPDLAHALSTPRVHGIRHLASLLAASDTSGSDTDTHSQGSVARKVSSAWRTAVSCLRSDAAGMSCPPRGTTCSSVAQAIRPITARSAPRPRGPKYSSHSP